MSKVLKSSRQTEELGCELAATLKRGNWLALYGALGAGKTSFVRGIARFFDCEDKVHSPTFNIVNIYHGKLRIAHIDLYRLPESREIAELEDIDRLADIVVIEWPEKAKNYLPKQHIKVSFEIIDAEARRIEIENADTRN